MIDGESCFDLAVPGNRFQHKESRSKAYRHGGVVHYLGVFAIAQPAIARFGLATLLGWLLILAGVGHLSLVSGVIRGIWQLILGAIYVIGGVFPMTHPLLGLGAITLLLSVVILRNDFADCAINSQMTGLNLHSGVLLVAGGLSDYRPAALLIFTRMSGAHEQS